MHTEEVRSEYESNQSLIVFREKLSELTTSL